MDIALELPYLAVKRKTGRTIKRKYISSFSSHYLRLFKPMETEIKLTNEDPETARDRY